MLMKPAVEKYTNDQYYGKLSTDNKQSRTMKKMVITEPLQKKKKKTHRTLTLLAKMFI